MGEEVVMTVINLPPGQRHDMYNDQINNGRGVPPLAVPGLMQAASLLSRPDLFHLSL